MTLPWWTGVPAAQTTLTCGLATHRLVWKEGALTAPDHADPEGERALAALGGEPLACIELLHAWRQHAEDPGVLLLGSRGPADLIAVPEEMPHQLARRPRPATLSPGARIGGSMVAYASAGGPRPASDPDPEERLARLLSLGGGLGRRLDATVAAHWRDRLLSPDAETDRLRARLHAALFGRVLATLAGWLGQGDVTMELELAPETASPSLRRAADGSLAATIPFGWLVEVWARGLEVVWGRFCLAATTADGHEWELRTVGPDLDEPTTLTVSLPD
jgi:hypothetical protein